MSNSSPLAEPRIAYDLTEAARQVCLSDDTLRAAIHNGSLAARMVGRKYVIRHVDLVAWVDRLPSTAPR